MTLEATSGPSCRQFRVVSGPSMIDNPMMSAAEPTGTPYSSSSPELVDDWSREVFDALSHWALADNGRWSRWEPGYLLLEIESIGGEQTDPILIDTADGELTVAFGYWETHLPEGEADAAGTAQQAIALVSQWLSGEIRTAVLTDASGKWCGTIVVEPGDVIPQLSVTRDWIKSFSPTHVEVRSPRRSDWRTYDIDADRIAGTTT